jgi:hypothetical protein
VLWGQFNTCGERQAKKNLWVPIPFEVIKKTKVEVVFSSRLHLGT